MKRCLVRFVELDAILLQVCWHSADLSNTRIIIAPDVVRDLTLNNRTPTGSGNVKQLYRADNVSYGIPDSGRYQEFEFSRRKKMLKTSFTLFCAVIALAMTANANAQSGSRSFGAAASDFGGVVSDFGGGAAGFGGGISDFGGGATYDAGMSYGVGGMSYGGGFDSGASYGGEMSYGVGGMSFNDVSSCNSCGTSGYASSYSSYGSSYGSPYNNSCGRPISNQAAASLWAGYCTESCATPRAKCNLFSRHRGGFGGGFGGNKFGYPRGGCGGGGCGGGCFGYPTGGCGCGNGAGLHGGLGILAKLKGRGGCGLFSKLKGRGCGPKGCGLGGGRSWGYGGGSYGRKSCGLGGLGLFGKCKARKTQYAAIVSYPVQTVAIDECGCGDTGQYFNYAVGSEYGTAGMQSSISGSLTGACSSCNGGTSVLDGGMSYDSGMSYDGGMSYGGGMSYDNTGAAAIIEQGAGQFIQ